jgi:hypothetical protein
LTWHDEGGELQMRAECGSGAAEVATRSATAGEPHLAADLKAKLEYRRAREAGLDDAAAVSAGERRAARRTERNGGAGGTAADSELADKLQRRMETIASGRGVNVQRRETVVEEGVGSELMAKLARMRSRAEGVGPENAIATTSAVPVVPKAAAVNDGASEELSLKLRQKRALIESNATP